MNWSVVLNVILIPALFGLGGLIVYLIRSYIPAILKRQDKELSSRLEAYQKKLEAELQNRHDRREHHQAQDNAALAIARETIDWSRQELTTLTRAFEAQSREHMKSNRLLEQLNNSVRLLAGRIINGN